MLELVLIIAGILLIIVFVLWRIWRWIFGGQIANLLIKMFNIAHERDMRVDPEAEIVPSEREPISTVMHQRAQQLKQQSTSSMGTAQSSIPQANIAATESAQKPVYQPPYTRNAGTIEAENQSADQNAVIEASDPLVDDQTFQVDDPIIDDQYIDPNTPSADTLEAHIPDLDSSPYGVRSADHSPGRRLRDKRYRRNASS